MTPPADEFEAADQAGVPVELFAGPPGKERRERTSHGAALLLGYSAAELRGLALDRTLSSGSLELLRQWQSGVLHEPPPALAVRHRDGGLLSVRVRLDLHRTPEEPVVLVLYQPTVRGPMHRELVDASPDAIYVLDGDRILYANPAAATLHGGTTPVLLSSVVHPEDWLLLEDLENGRSRRATLRLARGPGGEYQSIELVSRDIDWHERLAQLVVGRDVAESSHRRAQLAQAQRLGAMGTLAAGVAHEINNPLAYVLLNLQFVLQELPKLADGRCDEARLKTRLAEARHGAERVSAIVRDLRDFSSIPEADGGSAVLEDVIRNALRIAQPRLDPKTRVELDFEPVSPVPGAAPRIEQVFVNLLVNAAHALAEGPPLENVIRLRIRSMGQRVVAIVEDTGAGIPPELLGRVFDPFFTTKPADLGTGLGLPICHNIVASLGGQIHVESTLGKGTTFRVELPVSRGTPKRPEASVPETQSTSSRRLRILVVDDELPVTTLLERLLSDAHDVDVATDGVTGLHRMLGPREYDVVLCDVLMPGMSGMDVHRAVSQQRPGLESRLVFMTGGAFTPRAQEFLESVPNPRLEKPFDLARVRELIRKVSAGTRGSSDGPEGARKA